ncbi:hypothetical protein JXB27_04245 [Candidatus Woesearchaeota archaeon]|nr:hypothetical protein [Candidatus Woesearchaeota archaeon]
MAEDEEVSIQEQMDNLDAAITALVDLLVEKKLITQDEFDKKLDSMYEEE